MALPISQKDAWNRVRDGWKKLLDESGGSYARIVERGGPKLFVEKWETDVKRWKEYGVPYKFLLGGPASVAALMLSWGAKERWELAAIDELDPTTLDIAADELKNTQNAIFRKEGKPETAVRIVAPADSDPYAKAAEKVVDAANSVGLPKNPAEWWPEWLTARNAVIAVVGVAAVTTLGPTIAAYVGARGSSKPSK